jgi:hypothetical protein
LDARPPAEEPWLHLQRRQALCLAQQTRPYPATRPGPTCGPTPPSKGPRFHLRKRHRLRPPPQGHLHPRRSPSPPCRTGALPPWGAAQSHPRHGPASAAEQPRPHLPGGRTPARGVGAVVPGPRNVVATSWFLASRRELPNGGQRFSGRQPA